jgi:hypothetical protein
MDMLDEQDYKRLTIEEAISRFAALQPVQSLVNTNRGNYLSISDSTSSEREESENSNDEDSSFRPW